MWSVNQNEWFMYTRGTYFIQLKFTMIKRKVSVRSFSDGIPMINRALNMNEDYIHLSDTWALMSWLPELRSSCANEIQGHQHSRVACGVNSCQKKYSNASLFTPVWHHSCMIVFQQLARFFSRLHVALLERLCQEATRELYFLDECCSLYFESIKTIFLLRISFIRFYTIFNKVIMD